MTEPTYSPDKILTCYYDKGVFVIGIAGEKKPFICTDLQLATAVIEARLMEIKENDDKK
jgi:hypothetical protein